MNEPHLIRLDHYPAAKIIPILLWEIRRVLVSVDGEHNDPDIGPE